MSMDSGIRIPHRFMILHSGSVALVCGMDGQLLADQLHGLFAGDTRVLSTYRVGIDGYQWKLLGRSRFDSASAQWDFQNVMIREPSIEIPPGELLLTIKRRLGDSLHDEWYLQSFVRRPISIRFTLQLDSDFADIFEVKEESIPPRLSVRRLQTPHGVELVYAHQGFFRGLSVNFETDGIVPTVAGTMIHFEPTLEPQQVWQASLTATPIMDEKQSRRSNHTIKKTSSARDNLYCEINTAPMLQEPFIRGCRDLKALVVPRKKGLPYIAAGVPWFLTLFGRDTLMTSLMSGLHAIAPAEGALAVLGELQAQTRDDWRDAEPGKILHEIRHGELAHNGTLPHSPYYGTHDAPALYCLTLWNVWRWTGNRKILTEHFETARRCLQWCETLGDPDGDGFLEYQTRSSRGYFNQSWKDSGKAVVHDDGSCPELPIATVELQGYFFAALLAMAELFEEVGEAREAPRLREAAKQLSYNINERFWMDDRDFYAFGLDGQKQIIKSISSNPGHLLWCGAVRPDRAKRVADRFFQNDMFSGWGLRTLSTENPAYNPLSYQRGSVWPHDTMIAAAGLWRYGLREEASTLIHAILDAACAFEDARLPELFCGVDRANDLPVPYEKANSPQAWAAAVPILAVQLFLGLVPDAPDNRCLISPWLPDWLPTLEMRNIRVGRGSLDISLKRKGRETIIERINEKGIHCIEETMEAPLWGEPFAAHTSVTH